MAKINVKETEVAIINSNEKDYISITDIAKHKTDDTSAAIGNWMRNRNTIEFLGLWEIIHNPNFKPIEFEGFKKDSRIKRFYDVSSKMDNSNKCSWLYFKIR